VVYVCFQTAGTICAILTILLCFRKKIRIAMLFSYILFIVFWGNSAFVLDKEASPSGAILHTTKGRFKAMHTDIAVGDLIFGGITEERGRSSLTGLPYRWYKKPVEYQLYRVAFVSWFLQMRQERAASLAYRSGGEIVSTQAHIYAIRKYIPDKLADEYIITGLAHLLAMSGFNVGIFTAGLFLCFFFLPRKVRTVPVFFILPLLIPLSGFTVTVIRSVLFALAALFAWALDLNIRPLHFLALVAGFFLLFTPFNVVSISFLLSFFAVFGIFVLYKRCGLVKGIILIGIASSVFTLPIQLYFFGTANVLSVLTTVIMTPVVWAQMMMGLLASAFPDLMIAPLIYTERVAAWTMGVLSDISWHVLYVARPPVPLAIASFLVAVALCFTRFRIISLAILFIPLLPIYEKDVLIFPDLSPSHKGYVLSHNGKTEIFYQGMRQGFVRDILPEAARLGVKSFDYGSIRIFDGENLYVRIKEPGKRSGLVCVNEEKGCLYQYMTRSNSLSEPLDPNVKAFVLYNNNYRQENIFIQKELRETLTFSLK
jgi:competence protein ComEC